MGFVRETRERIRTDAPASVLADSFFMGMLRTRARYPFGVDEAIKRLEMLPDIFLFGALGQGDDSINGGE